MIEEEVMEGEKGKERGVKRKFELDEDELLRIAQEERAGARRKLDLEKVDAGRAYAQCHDLCQTRDADF